LTSVDAAGETGDEAPDENGFQPILTVFMNTLMAIVMLSVQDGDVDDLPAAFRKILTGVRRVYPQQRRLDL
jgi:hypothetical protein